MPLIHFLIVYDHRAQRLAQKPEEFTDADEAAAAYAQLEREHRDETNLEIVLLSADSLNTIRQTHGNYFNGDEAVAPGRLAGASS
jgi:hypothetical protein